MINKEVKSSERERESNNYTRATAIDLKTIDSEVALLSGRATQTPIDMQSLWNEVQNLKGNLGKYEIKSVSYLSETPTFSFVPNYIFVIGVGTNSKGTAFMKSAPIKNGSSGAVSVFSGASVPGYTAYLNSNTVRFTYTSTAGLSYKSTTILAF